MRPHAARTGAERCGRGRMQMAAASMASAGGGRTRSSSEETRNARSSTCRARVSDAPSKGGARMVHGARCEVRGARCEVRSAARERGLPRGFGEDHRGQVPSSDASPGSATYPCRACVQGTSVPTGGAAHENARRMPAGRSAASGTTSLSRDGIFGVSKMAFRLSY